MAIKSLEKTNLRKKTEGILLLNTTKWYWGQKHFCHFMWSFIGWYKMSHIYIGRTKSSPLCQNLENCRRNISAHRKLKKLRFFLFERTWTCEWFKILTNLKILKIFGHRYLCQRPFRFDKRNRRTLFAAASTCRRRKYVKNRFFYTKAYKSTNKINFSDFFGYSQRRGTHVHHVKKSTLYLYSTTFFAAKSKGAILCACVILCASETISRIKIGDSWWISS